jgi:manganese transport protein
MAQNPVVTPPATTEHDPYILTSHAVQEPPTTLRGTFKHLGPGFLLSAAIVGSGELIATTTLGAQAGFVTLWVILVSCLVKVALQLEFGKHVIHTGESTMASLNKLPGPVFGKANWSIWAWLFVQLFKLLQVGGIIGGVAITLNIALPFLSVPVWALVAAILTSLLVYRGYYGFIEKFALVMIGLFTFFTLASVFFLQYTEYALSWENLAEGLRFDLPPAAVGVAIAAFGITGVGGDEIMYYNYWCLEKGYAAYTGPRDNSPAWEARAKGWIRVMYLDALLAMVVYTLVTAAFYLLGAAVLHAQGLVPEGYEMIEILSGMYTGTLGPWAKSVFMVCALIVLYSTVFAAAASWTRIFSDAFGQIGWINFYDRAARKRSFAWMAWIFPAIWCVLFLFIKLPVLMILLGGFMTSVLLLLVVYAAYQFRYHRLPLSLKPSRFYDFALWLSGLSIIMVGVYGVYKLI